MASVHGAISGGSLKQLMETLVEAIHGALQVLKQDFRLQNRGHMSLHVFLC